MLLKYIVAGKDVPKQFNSKKMEKYCEKILTILKDEEKCISIFNKVLSYIANMESIEYNDRKVFEKKETTEKLINEIDNIISFVNPPTTSK